VLSGEATYTNLIVWFNPTGINPTIHRTRGEYTKHCIIDVIYLLGYEHEIKDTFVVYI